MVAFPRSISYSSLLTKLAKLSSNIDINIKYQLPNEDLDALISVSTDEDVENMMEEYERLIQSGNSKAARLRLFLFPTGVSRSSSNISSLLEGSRREHWFFDALNNGPSSRQLERGPSEVSSIVSEVPDYLFGLDHMDENREAKPKNRNVIVAESVSVSDPGSPAPVVTSSPYCSSTSIPDLPPVKTKVESPKLSPTLEVKQSSNYQSETGEQFMAHQTGYPGNSNMQWQYLPENQYPNPASLQPMPVYYVPGPVPGTNVPVQVQRVPIQPPYVQRFPVQMGQAPVGYRPQISNLGQGYGAGMRPVSATEGYDYPAGAMQDGGYYAARNAGVVPTYQATMVPVGTETQGSGAMEMKITKVTQPH